MKLTARQKQIILAMRNGETLVKKVCYHPGGRTSTKYFIDGHSLKDSIFLFLLSKGLISVLDITDAYSITVTYELTELGLTIDLEK